MRKAWSLSLGLSGVGRTPGTCLPNSPNSIRISTSPMKMCYSCVTSIDIQLCTEDAADFFVNRHIEIHGKPVPFIRKAKRILKVAIKGVQPEMTNDELMMELKPYVEHASSVRNCDRHYNAVTFYDGTKQVFVRHLTRHISRSMKIGKRWCLVFYKDQAVPERR